MFSRTILLMGRMLDQQDGLGVYGLNLFQGLLAADPTTRYVIVLATPRHEHAFAHASNAQVVVAPGRSKAWWDQVTIPRLARRTAAQLIFNPKFSVPIATRIPTVMVLRSSDWYVNPENYEWWDNAYIRIMLPLYARRAARLLSVSGRIRDDLVRFAGLDPAKVAVSYSAPAGYFRPDLDAGFLEAVAARWSLPAEFILSTGRVHHTGFARAIEYPGANLGNLVRAYRRYREAGGALPLVVAGRGLEPYLRTHGFGDADLRDVHFPGFVPHTDMPGLLRLASFFVLTTLYESFSLPLVEAMATGCPVVAPTTGAVPEIAGGAAMLADPRDPEAIGSAMVAMGASEVLRAEHAAKGLRRAADFSWPRTVALTLEAFDAALGRGRDATPLPS